MDARLPSLSSDELATVGAGLSAIGEPAIVTQIKKALFHEHATQRDVWKDFGPSAVR